MTDVKTCTKCGECKALEFFHVEQRNKDGRTGKCKQCHSEAAKVWRDRNASSIQAYYRQWRQENAERLRGRVTVWRRENPAARRKEREVEKASRSQDRENLSDQYIKRLIVAHNSGIDQKQIPPPLIEAKRRHLEVKRLIKERTPK